MSRRMKEAMPDPDPARWQVSVGEPVNPCHVTSIDPKLSRARRSGRCWIPDQVRDDGGEVPVFFMLRDPGRRAGDPLREASTRHLYGEIAEWIPGSEPWDDDAGGGMWTPISPHQRKQKTRRIAPAGFVCQTSDPVGISRRCSASSGLRPECRRAMRPSRTSRTVQQPASLRRFPAP